jgi:hypothetical protein
MTHKDAEAIDQLLDSIQTLVVLIGNFAKEVSIVMDKVKANNAKARQLFEEANATNN